MNKEELKRILDAHAKWLQSEGCEGKRADLSEANLKWADLPGANLSEADLSEANLSGAYLSGANLSRADLKWAKLRGTDMYGVNLTEADLSEANLSGANLSEADLTEANLSGAYLSRADLTEANLSGVNLTEADLTGADLTGASLSMANLTGADLTGASLSMANLTGADTTYATPAPRCPQQGSFTGYKKAAAQVKNVISNALIRLEIPQDARRSSGTGMKCRCDRAKVIDIEIIDGLELTGFHINEAYSLHDNNFIYRVGETVEAPDFDPCRWHECAPGIHFFMTPEEAIYY